MKDQYQIATLIESYLSKKLSAEEEKKFVKSLEDDEYLRRLVNTYKDKSTLAKRLSYVEGIDTDAAYQKVIFRVRKQGRKNKNFLPFIKYAAAVITILSFAFLIYKITKTNQESTNAITAVPFNNKTIEVRFSDGKMASLEKPFQFKELNGSQLISSSTGLKYISPSNTKAKGASLTNILNVPVSKIYSLSLSDGTKVWLNSKSRISYPVFFNGSERIVHLQGEAYFEVAKDKSRPFKVKLSGTEIVVLGTKFNVKSCDRLAITTLVEGAVKVNNNGDEKHLKPGEQATTGTGHIQIEKADLEKALAWRNGAFQFSNDGLHDIMNELARWYDLEVIYGSNLPKLHYSGNFSKQSKIDEVIIILSDITGLKFNLQGKLLKITNQ